MKDQSQPRWTVWLDVESSRDATHWLPWRPDKSKGQSEEDCEDPDRQVLHETTQMSFMYSIYTIVLVSGSVVCLRNSLYV